MNNVLTFHMVRHGPVLNPDHIWYGRDVEFDLKSPHIVAHFNQLAKRLPTDPTICKWFASAYPRAFMLAEFLIKASGVMRSPSLIIDEELIEQRYGEMEGMKDQEARSDPRFKEYFANMWEYPPKGGESLQMLQRRAGEKLDKLVDELPSHVQHVVIVAHGGFNMAALAHVQGERLIDVFQAKKQKSAPSFSYMSHLELQYDRDARKWSDSVEYTTGLPKRRPI